MQTTDTNSETIGAHRPSGADVLAGFAALRARVVAPDAVAASDTDPSRAKRVASGDLLALARHGKTDTERSRAAEELRRRIKTQCAAALDRYTSQLTAQEADDLTQDVLVRLLSAGDDTAPAELSAAYIGRVAVNLLIDKRRRLDRRGLGKPSVSLDDSEAAIAIPDPAPAVEEDVIGKFHQYQLEAALHAMLSPTEARVLWLRFSGDLPYAEIASEMGIKEANARKHYERGLKRLRTKVEGNGSVLGGMFAGAAG